VSGAPVLEASKERGVCELSNEPKKNKIKNRLGVFWCILLLHCSILSYLKHFGAKPLFGAPLLEVNMKEGAVNFQISPRKTKLSAA